MSVLSATSEYAAALALLGERPLVVLSGAGLSTESGIPDYRGPSGAARRHTPMTYQAFTRDPDARRRYWARSHLGWRTHRPGGAERRAPGGRPAATRRPGHRRDHPERRRAAHRRRQQRRGGAARPPRRGGLPRLRQPDLPRGAGPAATGGQPGFRRGRSPPSTPDGDVELPDEAVAEFRTVDCGFCGTGMLKPDVVFFGETVPAARVADCFTRVERARGALLVLGSSLTVMSGRRFVIRAASSASRWPSSTGPHPRRRAGDAQGGGRVQRAAQ